MCSSDLLRSLDEHAHVQARVALVRRLRIVVPLLMLPATAAVVAAAIFGADSPWRWASLAALTAFLAFSFLGTVPINMKVIEWNPSSPPPDWQATVRRWERLDVLRSTAAILAFVCVTAAGYFG